MSKRKQQGIRRTQERIFEPQRQRMKLAEKHKPTRSYQGRSLFTPVIKQHRSPQGCYDRPQQVPKPKGTQFLISLQTTEDGRPGSSHELRNVLGTSPGNESWRPVPTRFLTLRTHIQYPSPKRQHTQLPTSTSKTTSTSPLPTPHDP